jgi:hypothetical protein
MSKTNRFSLTALADEDAIERTELMPPSIPDVQPTVEAETVPETPKTPMQTIQVVPPRSAQTPTRVTRQSREVAAALEPAPTPSSSEPPAGSAALLLAQDKYRPTLDKKQVSMRIPTWLDKELDNTVLSLQMQGYKKISREGIMTEALMAFLNVSAPTD